MNLSIESMKQQARRLRASLATSGNPVSHGRALELVAHQYGFRDWNTAFAASGNRAEGPPANLGDHVSGRYLGQPFTGRVVGIEAFGVGGRWRMSLQFDKPVDVVTFDSFSALRSRVTVNLDADGKTAEKTSNGVPHLVLDVR
jgi:hypothetical protein